MLYYLIFDVILPLKISPKIRHKILAGGWVCYTLYIKELRKKLKGRNFMIEQSKVDMFFMTNAKYFPEEKAVYLKEKLRTMDDEKFSLVSTIELKDPTTLLLVSIFLGTLGIDRFMLGDTGMGILKLLTAGCCGVLTIVDWFTISKKTKEANFNKMMSLL